MISADALPDDGLSQPARSFAIGAVLMAMAIVVIDAGITNVALPTLANSLHIAAAQAIRVVTAYQAALVMTLLPCAALGERFGYRRVFVWGVALFTAASLASALSTTLPALVAARFVQGLGAAAILSLGVALLRFSVSDARLGLAISWTALTVALSAAAGPAIGALLLSRLDWPWLYAVNLPLGAGVMLAARALPLVPSQTGHLDLLSIGLNCVMFGSLVVGAAILLRAPVIAVLLMAAAALTGGALVRRERPKLRPLIPLDLLAGESFRISIIASVCCFTGQTAGLLALPFYLQHALGQSPMMAGLYMTAWPLSIATIATLTRRRLANTPGRVTCAIGGALLSAGLAALALCPVRGAPWLLISFLIVCGAGFAMFQVANNRNMFLAAPRDRSGAAGAMQGAARVSGQTTGAILVSLLFALAPLTSAGQFAFGIGAVLTLAAGLISLLRTERR
jgi:MFS transporter, DHA2 family, multidrug resistance protein